MEAERNRNQALETEGRLTMRHEADEGNVFENREENARNSC